MPCLRTREKGQGHAILHEQWQLRLPTLQVGEVILAQGEDDAHGGIAEVILLGEAGISGELLGEGLRRAVLKEIGDLLPPFRDSLLELWLSAVSENFFELIEDEDRNRKGRAGGMLPMKQFP